MGQEGGIKTGKDVRIIDGIPHLVNVKKDGSYEKIRPLKKPSQKPYQSPEITPIEQKIQQVEQKSNAPLIESELKTKDSVLPVPHLESVPESAPLENVPHSENIVQNIPQNPQNVPHSENIVQNIPQKEKTDTKIDKTLLPRQSQHIPIKEEPKIGIQSLKPDKPLLRPVMNDYKPKIDLFPKEEIEKLRNQAIDDDILDINQAFKSQGDKGQVVDQEIKKQSQQPSIPVSNQFPKINLDKVKRKEDRRMAEMEEKDVERIIETKVGSLLGQQTHNKRLEEMTQFAQETKGKMNEFSEDVGKLSENLGQLGQDINEIKGIRKDINELKGIRRDIDTIKNFRRDFDEIKGLKPDIDNIKGFRQDLDSVKQSFGKVCEGVECLQNDVHKFQETQKHIEELRSLRPDIDSIKGFKTDIDSIKGLKTDIDSIKGFKTDIDSIKGLKQDLDTVKQSFGKVCEGVDCLKNDVKKIQDQLQLFDLNKIQGEIKQEFQQLPQQFQQQNQQQQEQQKQFDQKIDQRFGGIEDKFKKIEEQIPKLAPEKYVCDNCGDQKLEIRDSYCPNCGTAVAGWVDDHGEPIPGWEPYWRKHPRQQIEEENLVQ